MPAPPALSRFGEYCAEATRRWGANFSCSALYPEFVPYLNSGEWVRVAFSHGETLTGWIGITGGFAPCFLLMRRRRAIGSSRIIDRFDHVIAVRRGGRYVSIEKA